MSGWRPSVPGKRNTVSADVRMPPSVVETRALLLFENFKSNLLIGAGQERWVGWRLSTQAPPTSLILPISPWLPNHFHSREKTHRLHKTEKDTLFTSMSDIVCFLWAVSGTRSGGGGREHKGWLQPSDHCAVLGRCSVFYIWWSWLFSKQGKTEVWEVNNVLRIIWLIKAQREAKSRFGGFQSLFSSISVCRPVVFKNPLLEMQLSGRYMKGDQRLT